MGDPERYRKQEEVKKWQENDPIGIFRKYLTEKKIATAKALDEIDSRVEEEVNKAVEFAETSPEPAMEDLFTDVYADRLNSIIDIRPWSLDVNRLPNHSNIGLRGITYG